MDTHEIVTKQHAGKPRRSPPAPRKKRPIKKAKQLKEESNGKEKATY
jgi:hypothetical protein